MFLSCLNTDSSDTWNGGGTHALIGMRVVLVLIVVVLSTAALVWGITGPLTGSNFNQSNAPNDKQGTTAVIDPQSGPIRPTLGSDSKK
jgi:hypothetical protein